MEEKTTLFGYVYGDLSGQIAGGTMRHGDVLPSMNDLCKRYGVGIRTVRDVLAALRADGYIATEERKRAVVTYRASEADERGIRSLLARKDGILDCYRTFELVMPPLFAFAARFCDEDDFRAFERAAAQVGDAPDKGDWRLRRSSTLLHRLLGKTGNPLLSECYASIERACTVPTFPGFSAPYARAMEDMDGTFAWAVESLSLGDDREVQRRFGRMYRDTATYVEAYLDELAEAYPGVRSSEPAFKWSARAGRERVFAQVARDLVLRIYNGEFADGDDLPSIAELADAYGVSPSTVQKTMGILNMIGVARTVNGCGTRVSLSDISFDRRALADGSFRRDIEAFVDALQMLCVIVPAAVGTVEGRMEAVARDVEGLLACDEDEWAVPTALMRALVDNLPFPSFQVVMNELGQLMLWGRFFAFFGPTGASTREQRSLGLEGLACVRAGDAQGLARAMGSYYRVLLEAVPAFFERAGASGLKRVVVP